MNDDNVNGTKEPGCFASKDDDRKNPILLLGDPISGCSANNGKCDGADEQLVVWKLKDDKLPDSSCNGIFDTNFNGTSENTLSSEEKTTYPDEEQCDCIQAWRRLKRYLELTDEELKRAHTYPEDVSSGKYVNGDDLDESAEDFQLDGEYLYAELDGSNSSDVNASSTESATSSADEAANERRGRSADVRTINKPAKNGRNAETTGAKVAGNVVQVARNNSKNHAESALNNGKQRKSKFGGQTDKCCAGGRMAGTGPKGNTTKQRMNTMKYVYTYGETYRGGIRCGHVDCVESPFVIPQNKGWVTEDFIINASTSIINFIRCKYTAVESTRFPDSNTDLNLN